MSGTGCRPTIQDKTFEKEKPSIPHSELAGPPDWYLIQMFSHPLTCTWQNSFGKRSSHSSSASAFFQEMLILLSWMMPIWSHWFLVLSDLLFSSITLESSLTSQNCGFPDFLYFILSLFLLCASNSRLWTSPVRKKTDYRCTLKSYGKVGITCNMNISHLNWAKTWAAL